MLSASSGEFLRFLLFYWSPASSLVAAVSTAFPVKGAAGVDTISGITTSHRSLLSRPWYPPSDFVLSQEAMATTVADTPPDFAGALNACASWPTEMPSTVVNSHGFRSVLTRRGGSGGKPGDSTVDWVIRGLVAGETQLYVPQAEPLVCLPHFHRSRRDSVRLLPDQN